MRCTAENASHDLPVTFVGGTVPAVSARVTIHVHDHWPTGLIHPWLDSPQELLAEFPCIRVRQHNLAEHVNTVTNLLTDDRAHGIHIEINAPEQRLATLVNDRNNVVR